MGQKNVIKNVTSTALAVGLSISMAGGTSTMLITGNDDSMGNYKEYGGIRNFQMNNVMQTNIDNIYVQDKVRNLDKVSGKLFGNMRDAAKEERESVDNYIKSISKSTGVNFFDIC